jgi:DNA phosphorothioation-associated putative methyltransferase
MPDPGLQLDLDRFKTACQTSAIGKQLPDALYVHHSAIDQLDLYLQACDRLARTYLERDLDHTLTIVKFSKVKLAISYLHYPEFDTDAHPALQTSTQVDLVQGLVSRRQYSNSRNPFILHRKETFVAPNYPQRDRFADLTAAEEKLGLLDNVRKIGTRQGWQHQLTQLRVTISDHRIQPLGRKDGSPPSIDRHKAAIVRHTLSKPVRSAIEAQLFQANTTFFDYGCGHGSDLELVRQAGYDAAGWDLYYRPDATKQPADIVNLGYVINVIEDPGERREVLMDAWELTRSVLIVAAQVTVASDYLNAPIAYGDGVITQRNTFQKYFEQEELKEYIDTVLDVDAIPISLGIYFVFRDRSQAESFRASRFRCRTTTPRIRKPVKTFEEYRELLTPLMDFLTERGRLPSTGELPEAEAIVATLGSLRRAFHLILQATDSQEWDAIAEQRRQELCMYLALTQFGKRPKLSDLAPPIREDIKGLLGSYRAACEHADAMLFSLGDTTLIEGYCRDSALGQQRPNSLWVHVSAFNRLVPALRLYEGCASRTIGRMESTTLIKLHINTPKISYIDIPDFDRDPHPALRSAMTIDLRDLHVTYRDYDPDNPPLLHRKHETVTTDYPLFLKFAKLSAQETTWGLLHDTASIYSRNGWEKMLRDRCCQLQGHRLIWQKDADPVQLKLRQSEARQRQRPIR